MVDDVHAAPGVVVETWFLHCDGERWQSLPPVRSKLAGQVHPHDVAKQVATRAGVRADVVHSTSWRMVDGEVVLTYIVVTGTVLSGGAFDVHRDHAHEHGTDPGHVVDPAGDAIVPPTAIRDRDVLHHAIHHLALLARTNRSVAAALSAQAMAALAPLAPAGAGALPASWSH